ncbi:MAG: hypothetical protein IKN04_00190 [Clostridia bacterium]|nr:hypothetical protein [Clostridia bacterium]
MKKEYEEPKAEKIDFDYSETVVASESASKNMNGAGNYKQNKQGSNGCCGAWL